ncbi:D-aminoacyl-tRNA deacylase [bacterium HR40]|nr:D-aminoacyl-tRNA deacylase [bacterium HR40]
MRLLLQRVLEAKVEVEGTLVGAIGRGLLVFFCAEAEDREEIVPRLAGKVARLRIFEDATGRMNLSLADVGGAALVVSQFTLAADIRRGNRPDFAQAAPPARAECLYRLFCAELARQGLSVATGRFAARMRVHLVNDGPVTIWVDSRVLGKLHAG